MRNPARDHDAWVRLPVAAERLAITSHEVLDLIDRGELPFEWDEVDAGIYVPVDALPAP